MLLFSEFPTLLFLVESRVRYVSCDLMRQIDKDDKSAIVELLSSTALPQVWAIYDAIVISNRKPHACIISQCRNGIYCKQQRTKLTIVLPCNNFHQLLWLSSS